MYSVKPQPENKNKQTTYAFSGYSNDTFPTSTFHPTHIQDVGTYLNSNYVDNAFYTTGYMEKKKFHKMEMIDSASFFFFYFILNIK